MIILKKYFLTTINFEVTKRLLLVIKDVLFYFFKYHVDYLKK